MSVTARRTTDHRGTPAESAEREFHQLQELPRVQPVVRRVENGRIVPCCAGRPVYWSGHPSVSRPRASVRDHRCPQRRWLRGTHEDPFMDQLSARISHLTTYGPAGLHGRNRRRDLGDPADAPHTLSRLRQTPVGRVGRVLSSVATRPALTPITEIMSSRTSGGPCTSGQGVSRDWMLGRSALGQACSRGMPEKMPQNCIANS